MVHQAAHAVKIPVMGIGGISSAADAIEFIMAGATAVQIGTASFIKPDICLDIIKGMEDWCAAHNVANIQDIRGAV
jgi:dihydroorotate dehydrogenase (NAD+) catalytic subunit